MRINDLLIINIIIFFRMHIKWNWGTKLVLAMVAFMLMIISMVIYMVMQDVSLVEKDYYPRGQAYQEMIEKVQNNVSYDNDITAWIENNEVRVSFPRYYRPEATRGSIHFYHRVSDLNDRMAAFDLDANGVFAYPADGLKGRYILKISWEQDGLEYYTEKDITVE